MDVPGGGGGEGEEVKWGESVHSMGTNDTSPSLIVLSHTHSPTSCVASSIDSVLCLEATGPLQRCCPFTCGLGAASAETLASWLFPWPHQAQDKKMRGWEGAEYTGPAIPALCLHSNSLYGVLTDQPLDLYQTLSKKSGLSRV
jgi:hypothetical protein